MSQEPKYVPQAGTIPAKVIAHFQTLPPGTELSTAMVLEAIGQPRDWHGLTSCMKTAVEHGVVSKRQDRAGWLMWSLLDRSTMVTAKPAYHTGQGVDIARASAPVGTGTDCTRSHPHENMSPACEAKTDLVRALAKTINPEKEGPAPSPAPVPTTEELAEQLTEVVDAEFVEVAISNTGRLLISTGNQHIALSPEQTQKVFQYLDEQRGIEWEAA